MALYHLMALNHLYLMRAVVFKQLLERCQAIASLVALSQCCQCSQGETERERE